MRNLLILLLSGVLSTAGIAQESKVPKSHQNILEKDGVYYLKLGEERYFAEDQTPPTYTLEAMKGKPKGTKTGLRFDFDNKEFKGRLFYGFIPYGDSRHPHPVFFKESSEIVEGEATIDILKRLSGRYDMVGWAKSEKGTLGYRVVTPEGNIIYDGVVTFSGNGPFEVDLTVTEGPFVNLLTAEGATISFETNKKTKAKVIVDGKEFQDRKSTTQHEILVSGLEAGKEYNYQVVYGENSLTYGFKTAPEPGTRSSFTFAYASDSRSGQGGGERDIYGANAYIMKKIMALATQQGASFFQFSGDLINGYLSSPEAMDLQYANWKRAIQPFAHYFPVYVSMGNHEALGRIFYGDKGEYVFLDRFPYDKESAEAVFKRNFVNPQNGPESEDGAVYDPDPGSDDFPSYDENVFYYTYDNVAVIVMNSDYWYAPSTGRIPYTGGGLHGYIMDNQLDWLTKTVEKLEADNNIDHVFVTQHTPVFPNGGHVGDDMWYRGNNDYRPFIAGKPLPNGIIQRRDQILDVLINQSSKVIAILTGDEHNYARTEINGEMNIYPEAYLGKKIEISRTIYQINNGAAGAPYYAQEETPWTPNVEGFTTQNALVLFHIEGKKIRMRVLNPDTLEEFDTLEMR
jgi:hypothetical protein